MKFEPHCLATGIGSLPHGESQKAVEVVLSNFPEIPFWPQLPKRSFKESMWVQFVEGFPSLVTDEDKKKVHIDTSGALEEALGEVYEHYLAGDVECFAITREYAEGLYAFVDSFSKLQITHSPSLPLGTSKLQFVKGQVTGPISLGLALADERGKAILYNTVVADALFKVLAMKARWQIRKLKIANHQSPIIIFLDEPYLASFGSAYLSVEKSDVIRALDEVIEAVHSEGAIAGIHCCGNTDWSMLLATKADIISFDAYQFLEPIGLYPHELEKFLKNGGALGWGIVPTSEACKDETAESLMKGLEKGIRLLVSKGLKEREVISSLLITPSCGTGTLEVGLAARVLELTSEVSRRMREKY